MHGAGMKRGGRIHTNDGYDAEKNDIEDAKHDPEDLYSDIFEIVSVIMIRMLARKAMILENRTSGLRNSFRPWMDCPLRRLMMLKGNGTVRLAVVSQVKSLGTACGR